MSLFPMQGVVAPDCISQQVFDCEGARNCLMPMGVTSENVAERYGVTREEQDQMAYESHMKASKAMKKLMQEITPYKTIIKDKEGNEKEILVDHDDGVRPSTSLAGLKKLKPAFKKTGSTTAGNCSQVTDGAAAVMLTRRSIAKKMGLKIWGRPLSFAVVGVPPDVMGIGPSVAIPAALKKAGLTIDDIEIFEINEAFASQATYCIKKLGIPREKLNPRGGAIAFGHPLGCTGSRQIVTLFNQFMETGKKLGVTSMCIGTGMGAACVWERE